MLIKLLASFSDDKELIFYIQTIMISLSFSYAPSMSVTCPNLTGISFDLAGVQQLSSRCK
jgi:hypothetical protein